MNGSRQRMLDATQTTSKCSFGSLFCIHGLNLIECKPNLSFTTAANEKAAKAHCDEAFLKAIFNR